VRSLFCTSHTTRGIPLQSELDDTHAMMRTRRARCPNTSGRFPRQVAMLRLPLDAALAIVYSQGVARRSTRIRDHAPWSGSGKWWRDHRGVWLGFTTAIFLACASGPRPVKDGGLRASAAGDLNCKEQNLVAEDLNPRTVRVSGCGRAALYSCKQAGISEPAGVEPNIPEHEARNRPPATPGHCSWVRSH
jgi:hypothetical protein